MSPQENVRRFKCDYLFFFHGYLKEKVNSFKFKFVVRLVDSLRLPVVTVYLIKTDINGINSCESHNYQFVDWSVQFNHR